MISSADDLRATARPDLGLFLIVGEDGIAELVLDQPGEKVNKLTTPVLLAFDRILTAMEEAGRSGIARGLLITSGKPGVFIAGADIAEIESIVDPRDGMAKARAGQKIFDRLEFLPVPSVAAVNGACVGGGYELALACTRIVAADDPKVSVGLPEVRLGIIPGFGGTQRLPRRVGLRRALDVILAGRTLDGRRAERAGLVDELAPPAILESVAAERLRALAGLSSDLPPLRRRARPLSVRLASWALDGTALGRSFVADRARKALAKEAPPEKFPAPWRALESVLKACELPARSGAARESGYENEARLAGEMLATPVSKNLIFLFSASSAAKRAPPGPAGAGVARAGVLGAGVMGAGIAQVIAEAGIPVRLKDVDWKAVSKGIGTIAGAWKRRLKQGRLDKRAFESRLALVVPSVEWAGFATCDLVLEAIVESLEVKRAVLAEAESALSPDAIFATNTSSLLVGDIAAGARRPERVVGLHFFNPAPRMPLVEVVAGPATDPGVVAAAARFAARCGKTPVIVRDGPGFLVNRLLMPYLGEALTLAEAGADLSEIDDACAAWGMPMGPFRLLDEIGLDVAAHAAGVLAKAYPRRAAPSEGILDRFVAAGRLGTKSGRGFYRHPAGASRNGRAGGAPVLDPEAAVIARGKHVAAAASEALPADGVAVISRGRTRRDERLVNQDPLPFAASGRGPWAIPHGEDLLDLLLLPIVNEAAVCLVERVVASPRDVDLAMVLGTGFPPFRGGPLRWADSLGAAEVCRRLERLAGRFGERLAPAPLLRDHAASGRRFH